MSRPNSKAVTATAADKPNTSPASNHFNGQGNALRMAMRGALTVNRRRHNLRRTTTSTQPHHTP
ncbi:hypothetical protein GCM10028785_07680 [Hydrogenophaga soli]